jgi:hypothetical protein
MATIKIPRTPASAYNDQRRASDLLRAHVQNLEKAVRGPRTRTVVTDSMTEAEAARYIRELARQLHHQRLLPDLPQAPTIGQRPERAKHKKAKARRRSARKGQR